MALLESLILLSIFIFLLYKWATAKYQDLKERGIPHEKPVPLFGNISIGMLLGKTAFVKDVLQLHQKFRNEKVYGLYSMREPLIFINDTELIKKIGIKDADNFINHGATFPDDGSELSRSLLILKDQQWKDMRNTLTPTFTGSKMRLMYELINECSIEGVKYLSTEIKATEKQELEVELKDYFTRFANDVIASAAFGIKVNSFAEKDNDFYKVGVSFTGVNGWAIVKSLLYGFMPKLMKSLGVKIMDGKKLNYFRRLVLDAVKYREQNNIVRQDMIHLLMQARKQSKTTEANKPDQQTELTDEDIVGQCLLFFFAGFDTVSSALCFTLHELMENPDVQDKLYEEIKNIQEQLDGQPLNYDVLMKMKYMDMVLSESLRKWPLVVALDRKCAKDYNLVDEEGNLIAVLKKDDIVWMPVIGQHRDPENFENPNKFDPERFSEDNKSNIKPFTYLPFGIGPRNCIGNRFAMMETKSIIYHLLLNFKIETTPKASKDLLNSIVGFKLEPKEKFWIKIIAREK